jgi:ABC-type transport system involved in cytochrome c biogenesis permease subunit
MYEALLFFSLAVAGFLSFTRDISLPALLVAVGLLVTALLLPDRLTAARPLPPALASAWFIPHVAFAFLGYGGILVAVVSPRRHHALPAALLCFTLALVAGMVWAEQAWAGFWTWDPKETWALATWGLLVAAMHMRLHGHRRLERLFGILALATVAYNFVVVNIVLRGLHSYH